MRALLAILAIAASSTHAFADTLSEAVSFAFTGSDAEKVSAMDRANCVFWVRSNS